MSDQYSKSQEKSSRFSTMQYLSKLQGQNILEAGLEHHQQHGSVAPFEEAVETIRSVLISPRGVTEQEKQDYSRNLNEAVLGIPSARKKMLTVIHDELVKRKLMHVPIPDRRYESLAEGVFAELIGWNVLELILKDKQNLEEIQVVGTRIYEVRNGQTFASKYSFRNVEEVYRIQQNLVLFNNEVFNLRKRWAEVMLADGARVTMTGFGYTTEPTLTIRLFPKKCYSLASLSDPAYRTIDDTLVHWLRAFVQSHMNMVVIGATNTGKTHLIKCLISEMPPEERIVTVESRVEMMLNRDFPQRNIIEYELGEDESKQSAERVFRLALRQSPKRIIHAEIRDADANIYVRACTRGHEGSVTSVHVSTLEDVPDAITDMCMLDARGMNPDRLRRRIVEYVTRIGIELALVNGKRRLVRMVEYTWEDEQIVVRTLVQYSAENDNWEFMDSPSAKTAERIRRCAPELYEKLFQRGGEVAVIELGNVVYHRFYDFTVLS